MELEELEVRFKANYSDFFEKTQEMASRVSEQTKSLMDKVQQFSNEYENAMSNSMSKVSQEAQRSADTVAQAENTKQQAYEQTKYSANSTADNIKTWSDEVVSANRRVADSTSDVKHQYEQLDLFSSAGNFGQSNSKVADEARVNMDKIREYRQSSAKDWAEFNRQNAETPQQVNLRRMRATEGDVDFGIDESIRSQTEKVRIEMDDLIDTINSKMAQAKHAQRQIQELTMRKNALGNSDNDKIKAYKFDTQIQDAQVKMKRYQTQAENLARSMRDEFNEIPSALKKISDAMERNEMAINEQRKSVGALKERYDALVKSSNGRNTRSVSNVAREYNKQSAELDRLIARQDKLAKSYSYVEERGKGLDSALSKISTDLGNESTKVNNLGNSFKKLRSGLSGARQSISNFNRGLSSMNNSSRAVSRTNEGLNRLRFTLRLLASQIVVFTLMYQGIMMMAKGFGMALKTNTEFSRSLNNIKVNMMTAFYPIYSVALPAINALMHALEKVTGWIAQFTSALTGMSLSASRSGANGLYSQIKAMNDTGSASKKASDSVKKAQQQQAKAVQEANRQIAEANKQGAAAVAEQNAKIKEANKQAREEFEATKKANEDLKQSLMGFDELNVLSQDDNKDNSKFQEQPLEKFTPQEKQSAPDSDDYDLGGDGGVASDPDALNFATAPLNAFQSAIDFANKLKKVLGELFDPMKEAWDAKGQVAVDATKYAWKELERVASDIGKSFMKVWTNGTGKETAENLIQLYADLLNIIGDIGRAFAQAWEKGDAGTKLIQSQFDTLNAVLRLIHDIATSFRNAFNSGIGESIFSNLIRLGTNLNKIVENIAVQFDKAWKHGDVGTSIFKTLLGMVNDIVKVLADMAGYTAKWAKTLDFTPLLKSIDNLLKAIRPVTKDVWDGLAWAYEHVLLPLAKFYITKYLPDWFDLLAAALKVVHSVITAAKPLLSWLYKDFIVPIAKVAGFAITGALKLLTAALEGLSSWIDKHQKATEAITATLGTLFGLKVAAGVIKSIKDFADVLGATALVKFDNLKEGFSRMSNIAKLSWNGVKTGAGYLKNMASITWEKISTGASVLKDIASMSWAKVKDGVDYLRIISMLAWDKVKAGADYLKIISLITWDKIKDGADYLKIVSMLTWDKVKSGASAIKNVASNMLTWVKNSKLVTAAQAALNLVLDANPIVLIVAAIAALVAGLVVLYKHNEKFREFVNGIAKHISEGLGKAWKWCKEEWKKIGSFIKHPIESTKDYFEKDGTFGNKALKFFSKTKDNVSEFLKKHWSDIKPAMLSPVLGVVTWFLKDTTMGKSITKWAKDLPGKASDWSKDVGSKIDKNITKAKKVITKAGANVGKWFSEFISGTNKTVQKWAGDIGSKVNSAVDKGKKLATKAGEKVGEWTTDFRDEATKSIKSWASQVGSNVNNAIDDGKKFALKAGDKIHEWTTDFRESANKTFRNWASRIGDHVNSGSDNSRNNSTNAGNKISSWVRSFYNTANNSFRSWASNIGGHVNSGVNNASWTIRNAGNNIGRWIREHQPGTLSTIGSWASGIGGRIADGIRGSKRRITSAMDSVKRAIVDPVKSAVNKVGDGVNYVLRKVGAGSMSWSFWANGTDYHPGGPAIVNDQPGDVYRESYQLPDGRQGIFPAVRNLPVMLPKGTKVKKASDTAIELFEKLNASMPIKKYAGGIGSFDLDLSGLSNLNFNLDLSDLGKLDFSNLFSGIDFSGFNFNFDFGNLFSGWGNWFGNIWSGVTDALDEILDDITHPGKLIDYIFNKFVPDDSSVTGGARRILDGTKQREKKGMFDWAKKLLQQFGGSEKQNGAGAEGWRSAVKKALRKNGLPTSAAYVNAWIRQIATESGGNEHAINGWDSNAAAGHPSKGLLQTIDSTFNAYAFPGHHNIWKGYDNILAAINYAKNRYGATGMLSVIGHGHGYELGGLIDRDGMYRIGEGNKPEMVIPLTNVPRAVELMSQAVDFMSSNFGHGLQMPDKLTRTLSFSDSFNRRDNNQGSFSNKGFGLNNLGPLLVNALVQAMQMTGTNQNQQANQPLEVVLQVDSDKLGTAAIKGINSVNQKNGRNMLNL
ncbi:lytic transglycosylase [Ligilactobacillus salivarius]|uniref:lytic transglycosylase n=1 Tax=Ligilactobacillus salivarius TaxID=1624 RepID=UPI003CFCF9CF